MLYAVFVYEAIKSVAEVTPETATFAHFDVPAPVGKINGPAPFNPFHLMGPFTKLGPELFPLLVAVVAGLVSVNRLVASVAKIPSVNVKMLDTVIGFDNVIISLPGAPVLFNLKL